MLRSYYLRMRRFGNDATATIPEEEGEVEEALLQRPRTRIGRNEEI